MHPKVTICLPNLNQGPFIEARMNSIVEQTFKDWECVAFDNCSVDGSWEVIQDYAARDGRITALQAPPEGMYANWNNCIRAAKGEFIYIATSDDTMSLDCLEKMVAALDANPGCDVCQCGLQMIDKEGAPMTGENGGLCWEKLANASFYGDQLKYPHIRKAPYDGLVALAYGTAWTSMTQVLVRRTLFDKVGLFPTEWNAVGDAAWQMKAGLAADVCYIPEKLATWRYYEGQGSGAVHQRMIESGWMNRMNTATMEWLKTQNPRFVQTIRKSGLLDYFRMDALYHRMKCCLTKGSYSHCPRVLCSDFFGYAKLVFCMVRNKLPISRPKLKNEAVKLQISKTLKNTEGAFPFRPTGSSFLA